MKKKFKLVSIHKQHFLSIEHHYKPCNAWKKELNSQGGPAWFDGVRPGDSEPARGKPLPPRQDASPSPPPCCCYLSPRTGHCYTFTRVLMWDRFLDCVSTIANGLVARFRPGSLRVNSPVTIFVWHSIISFLDWCVFWYRPGTGLYLVLWLLQSCSETSTVGPGRPHQSPTFPQN